MTEMVYEAPMTSFVPAMKPDPVTTVPILAEGRKALEHINSEWGLGMDEADIEYYTGLFKKMGRCVRSRRCWSCAQPEACLTRRAARLTGTRPTSKCLISASPTRSTAATGTSQER